MAHLKKVYGRSAMAEVMQDAINATVSDTLTSAPSAPRRSRRSTCRKTRSDQPGARRRGRPRLRRQLRSAAAGRADGLQVHRLDKPGGRDRRRGLDKEVQRVFRQNRGYEDKGDDGIVETGDRLGLSFKGTIDGEAFAGRLVRPRPPHCRLGEFIPGFEEQLVGMKKGETQTVNVTFPADYAQAEPGRQGGRVRGHHPPRRRPECRRARRRLRQEARARGRRCAARRGEGADADRARGR